MKGLLSKLAFTTVLLAAFIVPAFSQDDDEVEFSGRVLDAGNLQIGKAEFIQDGGADVKIMFGYYIKMWLDGGRVRVIKPESGSRSGTIICNFQEYKVDSSDPKDDSRWKYVGSGTASLKMPPSGEVRKIAGSMTLTKKIVGSESVEAGEKPQQFTIVID